MAQIEGLPEGATVRPLPQTSDEDAHPQIEGLPEGATVRPLRAQTNEVEGLPKGATVRPVHDERYYLTHPEAVQPKGVGIPKLENAPTSNTDRIIRKQPTSYTEQALTATPSTSATNIPAMTTEDIEGANQIAQHISEEGAKVGRKMAVTNVANMRGPSYASPFTTNASTTPQENTEEFRKDNPHAAGIAEGVGGIIGGTIADPRQLALMIALPEASPAVQRLASAAFTAYMAPQTAKGWQQLVRNWDSLTPEERSEQITQLSVATAATASTAGHTLGVEHINPLKMPGDVNENTVQPLIDTARIPAAKAGIALERKITPKNIGRATGLIVSGAPAHTLIPGIGGELIGRGIGAELGGRAAELLVGKVRASAPLINLPESVLSPETRAEVAWEKASKEADKDVVTAKRNLDQATKRATATGNQNDLNQQYSADEEHMNAVDRAKEARRNYEDVKSSNIQARKYARIPDVPTEDITARPGIRPVAEPEVDTVAGIAKPGFRSILEPTETANLIQPEAKPTVPATPKSTETRGNVPDDLRSKLKSNGYSDLQISRMRPEDAEAHAEVTGKQRTEVKATRSDKAVELKSGELSDANLRGLAKSVGIDPEEYDFNARDANRHRVERDQLAKDVTAQLHPEETMRLAENAERMEKEGLWESKDTLAKGKAARAAELFKHRLSDQPLDAYGNPKASGGAPDITNMSPKELHENLGFGERNTHVTKDEFEANRKEFLDKASRSNSGVDPTMLVNAYKMAAYYFEGGLREFAAFSKQMVSKLGESIKPHLQEIYARAKAGAPPTWSKTAAEWTAKRSELGLDELSKDDIKAKISDLRKQRRAELTSGDPDSAYTTDKVKAIDAEMERLNSLSKVEKKATAEEIRKNSIHTSKMPEAMGGPKVETESRIGERLEPNDPKVQEKLDRYTSTDSKNPFYKSVKQAIRNTVPNIPADVVTEIAHDTMLDFRENVLNGKFKVPAYTVDEGVVRSYLATGDYSIAHNKASAWAKLAHEASTGEGKGSLETPDTLRKSEGSSPEGYRIERHDTSSEQQGVLHSLLGGGDYEPKNPNLPEEMKSPYGFGEDAPFERDDRPRILQNALDEYLKAHEDTADVDRVLVREASKLAVEKAEAARDKAYAKEFAKSGDVDSAVEAGHSAYAKKQTATDRFFGLTDADHTELGRRLSKAGYDAKTVGTKIRARLAYVMADLQRRAVGLYRDSAATGRPRVIGSSIQNTGDTYEPIANPSNTWMSPTNPDGPLSELIPTKPTMAKRSSLEGKEIAEPFTNARGKGERGTDAAGTGRYKSFEETLGKEPKPINTSKLFSPELIPTEPSGNFETFPTRKGKGYTAIHTPDFNPEHAPVPKESTQSTGRDVTPGTAQARSDVRKAQEAYDKTAAPFYETKEAKTTRLAARKVAKEKLDAEREFAKSVQEEAPKETYGNEPQLVPIPKNESYAPSRTEQLIPEELGRGGRVGITPIDVEGAAANRNRISNMPSIDNAQHDLAVAKAHGTPDQIRRAQIELAKAQRDLQRAFPPSVSGGSQEADVNAIASEYLKQLQSKGATIPRIAQEIPEAAQIIPEVQREAARYGVKLKAQGFEEPTEVSHAGQSGTQMPRIAIGRPTETANLIPEPTSEEIQTGANRFNANKAKAERVPTKEERDINALAVARERLGLKHEYAPTGNLVETKPVSSGPAVERLRTRAGAQYDFSEGQRTKSEPMRHTVTATDAKGNHLATVEAVSDRNDPSQWQIKGSISDAPQGHNIGREAYVKLLRSAESKGGITVRGDDEVFSDSARATWKALQKEFPGIKWSGKGDAARPSIVFEPKKPMATAPLPRAMGGETPEPTAEEPTFMGLMRKHINKK